ncbi:wyosine base formation domain-containing protein [Nocardioides sp. Root151]|nr:wyosine base formation domain-containing protein [Nocardioides sp. Root140]KQZ68733.1 wyosine base formation domain-containing protein [Nocardioides sp. Root151]
MGGTMTAVTLNDMVTDLAAETTDLAGLLLGLSASEWELATPAAGWAVRDQVSHLAFFDEAAIIAITEPDRFRREAETLMALGPDFPDRVAERFRETPVVDLADWFADSRATLLKVLGEAEARDRVPWYGPDMSVMSCATARLMETWAHGLDISDTFGVECVPTSRLRHIAHLGVRTRAFSYVLRARPAPEAEVRIDLAAPDGDRWTWGPPDAAQSVTGTALDFCFVVTQRRHVADTDLVVRGHAAAEWMSIAQAFAGAPSDGRPPSLLAKEIS